MRHGRDLWLRRLARNIRIEPVSLAKIRKNELGLRPMKEYPFHSLDVVGTTGCKVSVETKQ